MKFINRETGEILNTKNRQVLLHTVLSTVYYQFMLESRTLNKVVEKYKNAPLLPYVMTEKDKKKIAKNPDAINDIPRFVVSGYDKAVSDSRFDQLIWNEFIERYNANDKDLCDFINNYHPIFKATLEVGVAVRKVTTNQSRFLQEILVAG